jgi:hypothetical protein
LVSEVIIHWGREGRAEKKNSHHGGQEAERERMPVLVGFLFLSFYSIISLHQ